MENPFKVSALDGFSFAYICHMFVPFENLSEEAKVWIYPSSRKFHQPEIPELEKKIEDFITDWKSDDESFKASYQLKYNRFIVFSAEGDKPFTNADIDLQVAFIIQLQEGYKVELLDKMNVCFKQGEYVQYKDLKDFKKLVKNKAVNEKSIVFDNLITSKSEFKYYWEVPITESWYKRFL
ncbi:ABC transporter ATPase [Tenacibaculum todarodis]